MSGHALIRTLILRATLAAGVFVAAGCVPPPAPQEPAAATIRAYDWSPKRTVLASDEVRVPFRLVNGMPYVSVDIGRTTASFLLDTGANNVVIFPKLADEELASIGNGTSSDGAGGSVPDIVSHLLSMNLGSARFDDLDAGVSRLHNLELPGEPADLGGELGWLVFKDVLLTIDFPNRTLIVRRGELPPADGKEILPIQRKGDNLFIPVSLNGKELLLLADTGAGGLTLTRQDAFDLKWRSPLVAQSSQNAHGDSQGEIGRIDGDLHIGRYVVRNPVAYVDGARESGIIGDTVLGNFAVTFDLRNMRLRLERPSDDPIGAPGISSITFRFNLTDHKVISVDKGGAAERAGVHVGDEVLTLNGQPISDDGSVNWPEDQPLLVDLKRDGQPIHVELDIKPLVR